MRRLLLGAALAAGGLALAAPGAGAATIDIAGLDDGDNFRFTPPDVVGQPGDTVNWGFAQATAPHNVNLVRPGVDPANEQAHELLGFSNPGAATPFSQVLDQQGTYLYYCSLHGGLAGMSGRLVIGQAGDAPPLPTGPAPQPNVSVFSSPFEEGDVVAPALTKVGALAAGRRLRVRYRLGEAATLTVRVARGRKALRTAVFKGRRPGVGTVTLKARLRPGRYTVTVTATDAAKLATSATRKLRIGG